ncbi:MAG: LysR family transcriptional regulator [Woeseiaceae bacterium]
MCGNDEEALAALDWNCYLLGNQLRIAKANGIRLPCPFAYTWVMIDIARLSRIKLSLLATFQALLQERSAVAAAKKLRISQSAVSKNLAQLRLLFDDQLFDRTPHGLEPTPLARKLEGPLNETLFQIDKLLSPAEFIAGNYDGRVRLALHDAAYAFIAAPLMAICEQKAPGIKLDLWFKDVKGLHELANAEIDLLVLPQDVGQHWHDDEHLVWQKLYQEPLVCLLRPGHPALDDDWTTERYLECRHIGVRDSQLGAAMLDQHLHHEHAAREFSAMTPDFHTATRLVQQSDAVFTCSLSWAELVAQEIDVVKRPLPFPEHICGYYLIWHERNDNSPLHQWLRDRIFDICAELRERYDLAGE